MKAVFLFTIGICHADENQVKNPSAATMETIVVTAGRVEEQKKEVIANVTIIDEQEIRQSSARDLGDLLAQKGIAVRKYPGNLTTIGIRGFKTDSHGLNPAERSKSRYGECG